MMAARQSSDASYRRRQPRAGSTDHDGTIPSYLGHGGLISGEVTPVAETVGMVTVTLPKHERRS